MTLHYKPIFNCYANKFALGTGVGLDPQRHTFASPNVKDTNMLVSFALGDANFSRHLTQNPNKSQWNVGCVGFHMQNFRVGHVHFMLFVLISYAFGGQRKPSIQWNMGFKVRGQSRLICIPVFLGYIYLYRPIGRLSPSALQAAYSVRGGAPMSPVDF